MVPCVFSATYCWSLCVCTWGGSCGLLASLPITEWHTVIYGGEFC